MSRIFLAIGLLIMLVASPTILDAYTASSRTICSCIVTVQGFFGAKVEVSQVGKTCPPIVSVRAIGTNGTVKEMLYICRGNLQVNVSSILTGGLDG